MPATAPRDVLRPIRVPAYSFLAVTLFLQLSDFVLGMLPLRPTAVVWRFQAFAVAANNIGNILLLILLFYAFALLLNDRMGLIVVLFVTTVAAVILFLAAGGFALDTLQLRSRVDQQLIAKFDQASAGTMIKFVVQGVISALFALSALRSYRSATREYVREERGGDDTVLVRGTRSAH